MALLVWLPLNGNLNNQGLSNVNITNNRATVDNNGKIGPCYRFQTNSNYITLNKKCCDLFKDGDSFSYCCWIKIIAYSTSSNGSGTGGTVKYLTETSTVNGSTVNGGGFGILINTAGTATGYANPFSGSFAVGFGIISLNTWTHLTLTYNKSTKILSSYVNGNFISKSTASSNWGSNGVNFIFGRGSQGGWTNTSDNYQNDIRIYDHCLSPKEVHEIAKGLILHYPLHSNNISLSTNLITGFVNGGLTTISGNNIIISGNNLDTYFKIKTSKTLTLNKQYKLSCIGTGFSNDSYYNFPIGGLTNTSPGLLKIKNGYCELIFIANDVIVNNGTTIMLDDAGRSASAGTITNIVLLEYENVIYDYSGYCNHGSITGTLTTDGDSPRYTQSTVFDGSNSIIKGTLQLSNDYKYTASFWVKPTSFGLTRWIFAVASGSNHLFGCYLNGDINTLVGGIVGSNSTVWSAGLLTNTLYHIVITSDGTNVKVYKNGELLGTNTKNGTTTGTTFWIGLRPGAAGSYNYHGILSDFRIYCTALSENDIKELYNTSALIDNKGDLFGYLFNENILNQICKNGSIELNSFIEPNEYVYLPAGTYISTGLIYENGDSCKTEITIRYKTGGSGGRDLMGYSGVGGGYWGVKSDGTWEPHGTFSYTNSDITQKNLIEYQFSSATEHGEYKIGILGSSYSVRDKYIYRAKLYKNNILERDLYPIKIGDKVGLFDILHNEYYLANNTSGLLEESNSIQTSIYNNKIEANQLIEI